MGKIPDFFIIGTMKGGTTILYDYICTHPDIVGGNNKENHYFSLFLHKGVKWYEKQFNKVPEDKYLIDASPTYFDTAYNTVIPSLIKKYNPDAKIILIVRDPIARAVSHFHHLKRINKVEILNNINLNNFFSRDFSRVISKTDNIDYYLNLILDFSSYYRKYLYYKNVFPSEQLLVITNDELRNNPLDTMRKVYNHLGVSLDSNDIFGQIRYSNGSSIDKLSRENYEKLSVLLYPNYQKFCSVADIPFKTSPQNKEFESSSSVIPDKNKHTLCKGNDGWLFLTGGSNKVLDYYTNEGLFTRDLCYKWWNILNQRKNRLNKDNIQYLHLIVPEKLSIYPEFYKGSLPHFSSHPLSALFKYIDSTHKQDFIINPIPFFTKNKSITQLYWKTDTHWTFWGAYSAYQLCCSSLKLPPLKNLIHRPYSKSMIYFDLGGKLDPPIKEEGCFYNVLKRSQRIFSNELVNYQEKNKSFNASELHVGTHVIFKNDHIEAYDQTVVIFGDSFSEYRPYLLTGLFAETFREVHFIWSSNIDYDYIKRVNATIVLTEITERFMGNLPTDTLDINEFSKKRLRKYLADNN